MVPTNDFCWERSSLPCAKCRIQDGRHRGIYGHRSIDHIFSTREGTSLPPEIFSRDPNTFIKAKKRLPPEIARFQLNIGVDHWTTNFSGGETKNTSVFAIRVFHAGKS